MPVDDLPLYRLSEAVSTACSNVHNVSAGKGRAGAENRFPRVAPGESLTVAELDGPAVITRLWLTFDWPGAAPYPGAMLRNRAVRLRITWDDAERTAIDVPVGDFFCHPLGYSLPFENALFASPTGRSLMCSIPMPFRRRARIELVNDFDHTIVVFHDIRFVKGTEIRDEDGYLHAHFNRTLPREPGLNHEVLPLVQGKGRYLGTHLGIITDRFNPLHWHGANPKFFFDGDDEYPSMMGASLDDFGGASWAYDAPYMHRDSGLLLSRRFDLGGGHYGFYFYHRVDPLHFTESCAVSIRPTVGLSGQALLSVLDENPGLAKRLALPEPLDEIKRRTDAGEEVWVDCGRRDDYSSVALYYLDRSEGGHDALPHEQATTPTWQWPADCE